MIPCNGQTLLEELTLTRRLQQYLTFVLLPRKDIWIEPNAFLDTYQRLKDRGSHSGSRGVKDARVGVGMIVRSNKAF